MKFDFSKISGLGERLGFNNSRPPLEKFFVYFLLFFMSYLIADLSTLYLRQFMLPVSGSNRVKISRNARSKKSKASLFSGIKEKNIFNADHFIPPSVGEKKGGGMEDNSAPVRSSLPLDLVGTLVHGNSQISVATVQVKGKKEVEPYKIEDEVDGMARITEILREKVIFRNLRNRKLEYIEIKDNAKIRIGLAGPGGKPIANSAPAEKTNFTFQRSEITKHLENLPQVLQDAKAIPYIPPGSGGEVAGFKLVAIKPGSIYEKLGLKRGDVIKGVNGEVVDTPQKAMELYQALKSSSDIKLDISRGGSSTTLNYSIE